MGGLDGKMFHSKVIGHGPCCTQSICDDQDKSVIVKKSSPKNLSADCRSTVGRQSADSLPTANQQVTDRLGKKKNCVKNEQLT